MHKTQGSEFGATFVVLTNTLLAPLPRALVHGADRHQDRLVILHEDQMGEVAAETVEFPDHESVALPQGAQVAVESRSVVAYAGSEVVVVLITAAMGYTWSGIFGLIAPSVCRLVFSSMERPPRRPRSPPRRPVDY